VSVNVGIDGIARKIKVERGRDGVGPEGSRNRPGVAIPSATGERQTDFQEAKC
jgi:hypothetical protein